MEAAACGYTVWPWIAKAVSHIGLMWCHWVSASDSLARLKLETFPYLCHIRTVWTVRLVRGLVLPSVITVLHIYGRLHLSYSLKGTILSCWFSSPIFDCSSALFVFTGPWKRIKKRRSFNNSGGPSWCYSVLFFWFFFFFLSASLDCQTSCQSTTPAVWPYYCVIIKWKPGDNIFCLIWI